MNQYHIHKVREIAGTIKDILRTKELKEATLNNLIAENHPRDDDFYLALDWLARENEILFLVTPKDTYVLPVGNQSFYNLIT
jgi:hypothetical protein